MAQVVAATFMTLTEAQIAAGALHAHGLHPFVADADFGSALWTEQFALQGFRLFVPQSEAAEAAALIGAYRNRKVRRPRPRAASYAWSAAALVLTFTLGPAAAWLVAVAGFRRRVGRQAGAALMVAFMFVAAWTLIAVGAISAGGLLAAWPQLRPYLFLPVAAAAVIAAALWVSNRFEGDSAISPVAPEAQADSD